MPASIAGAVGLVSFLVYVLVQARVSNARLRAAYRRVRESDLTYTFTGETIRWSMRDGHADVSWDWLDRIVQDPDLFVFARGYWYLCVPRRDVPPERLADFLDLIVKHDAQPRA